LRGDFHVKLNIAARPIAKKYCEGKMKMTLERELKVPETFEKEANETSFLRQDCCWLSYPQCFLPLGANIDWEFEEKSGCSSFPAGSGSGLALLLPRLRFAC
jgi:hypothetical protein